MSPTPRSHRCRLLLLSFLFACGIVHAQTEKPDQDPGATHRTCALAKDETHLALDQRADFKLDKTACGAHAMKWQLWLDGLDSGVRSVGCDTNNNVIVFQLSRDGAAASTQTATAWTLLLQRPFSGAGRNFERSVNVSIANEKGEPIAACNDIKLRVVDIGWAWGAGIATLLAMVLTFVAATRTDMLRDAGPVPSNGVRPYSLARVQMCAWFVLVFLSFMAIWLVCHEVPHLPGSILALMGIAGGTAVTARGIDQSHAEAPQPSQGFWRDIATDANGATLYRIQQVVWTIGLATVFIAHVLTKLVMPDFDGATLALMGISAGAYLGFKVPESHVAGLTNQVALPDDPKSGYST